MAKFEINHAFLIHGIIGFLFGVGFMVIPTPITTLMGLSLGTDGIALSRICGAMIFGFGMIVFGVRKEPHSIARQQIMLALIVAYALMTLFNLLFFDLTNLMVWGLILMHAAIVVVYGYFFMKYRGK